MNHLAHVLLAGPRAHARLGAMLGDFWRGAADPDWPRDVEAGVRLHRKMDVYTDSHPVVAEARRLFEPPLRRYAGILLDVHFDHVLARDWTTHADQPLAALSADVLAQLAANAAWLPENLNRFAGYMQRHGLFGAYARRDVIGQVLAGIGARLRHENPLAEAAATLWRHAAALDEAFARFFPDLRGECARLRQQLGIDGP